METIVKILLNHTKAPARKVADAELHFGGGDLDGLKLVGFSIWQRRERDGFDVTFPSREFTTDGRRRRYALLRSAIPGCRIACVISYFERTSAPIAALGWPIPEGCVEGGDRVRDTPDRTRCIIEQIVCGSV